MRPGPLPGVCLSVAPGAAILQSAAVVPAAALLEMDHDGRRGGNLCPALTATKSSEKFHKESCSGRDELVKPFSVAERVGLNYSSTAIFPGKSAWR